MPEMRRDAFGHVHGLLLAVFWIGLELEALLPAGIHVDASAVFPSKLEESCAGSLPR